MIKVSLDFEWKVSYWLVPWKLAEFSNLKWACALSGVEVIAE